MSKNDGFWFELSRHKNYFILKQIETEQIGVQGFKTRMFMVLQAYIWL